MYGGVWNSGDRFLRLSCCSSRRNFLRCSAFILALLPGLLLYITAGCIIRLCLHVFVIVQCLFKFPTCVSPTKQMSHFFFVTKAFINSITIGLQIAFIEANNPAPAIPLWI